MCIARLNFSHGSHEVSRHTIAWSDHKHVILECLSFLLPLQYHAESIANIRKAAARVPEKCVAIALDTKGPEIRTGLLKGVSETHHHPHPLHHPPPPPGTRAHTRAGVHKHTNTSPPHLPCRPQSLPALVIAFTPLNIQGGSAEIELYIGNVLDLSIDEKHMSSGDEHCIYVDYKNIVDTLNVGDVVYIDDGLISTKVVEKNTTYLRTGEFGHDAES